MFMPLNLAVDLSYWGPTNYATSHSSDFAKTNSHDRSYKKSESVMVFLKDFFVEKN